MNECQAELTSLTAGAIMPLKTELRKATGEPRELIVIVHGLKRAVLDHVPRVVSQHVPQADVLIPQYDAPWVSNVDAVQIADEISEAIQIHYDQHERASGRAYAAGRGRHPRSSGSNPFAPA